ncbi:hypothetical protein ACTHQ6_09905 [Arthrobacter sp. SAFR-179]|uniref:hypothetical protein n=1 Tax=Arthrobacter sp. SAFR-179 TaxID=3387279 RepID=UPI003F7B78B4
MTTELAVEAEKLTDACRVIFGDPTTWMTADGYPSSLALCIIDSLWSTGPSYGAVQKVVARYSAHRRLIGHDASQDGTDELLHVFKDVGGSGAFADLVGNHNRAYADRRAPLKAEVVYQAALSLHALGIRTMKDLRERYEADEHLTDLKKVWLRLPSQSSGVTFNYFLILAGYPSVKPDRMIIRFVKEHGAIVRELTPMQTGDLIKQVATLYPVAANRLDHVVWRYASGRKVFRDKE